LAAEIMLVVGLITGIMKNINMYVRYGCN